MPDLREYAAEDVLREQTAKSRLFLYFVAFLSGIVIDGRTLVGV